MKKTEPYHCPNGFFEEQEKAIIAKTASLESWKLPSVARPEERNSVPDSLWLQMEEGIRDRIRQPEKTVFSGKWSWQPALAGLILLLSIGLGWKYFPHTPDEMMHAEARVNQLNQQEILLYLTENPEAREISEQMALQQIPSSQLNFVPEVSVNAEELLENLDETDLVTNL